MKRDILTCIWIWVLLFWDNFSMDLSYFCMSYDQRYWWLLFQATFSSMFKQQIAKVVQIWFQPPYRRLEFLKLSISLLRYNSLCGEVSHDHVCCTVATRTEETNNTNDDIQATDIFVSNKLTFVSDQRASCLLPESIKQLPANML